MATAAGTNGFPPGPSSAGPWVEKTGVPGLGRRLCLSHRRGPIRGWDGPARIVERPQALRALQKPARLGVTTGLAPVTHLELVEDAVDVVLDRAKGQVQLFGNLLVGQPRRDHLQDFLFASAQALPRAPRHAESLRQFRNPLEQARGDTRRTARFSSVDRPD